MGAPFRSTWRSTQYNETFTQPSPSEAWAIDQGRATRVIECAWLLRKQATLDFLGYAEVPIGGSGLAYLSRTIPHNYPFETRIWCTANPKVEGLGPRGRTGVDGAGSMIADFHYAMMTLGYSTPPYDIMDDVEMGVRGFLNAVGDISEGVALRERRPRYISYVSKPGMQQLIFNKTAIKRADTNPRTPLPEGIPIPLPYEELEFTWWHVPEAALPRNVWAKSMGTVNNATFFGRAAETLLLEAPQAMPITGPFGDRLFNVVFRMKFKPLFDYSVDPPVARGWNHILVPAGPAATSVLKPVEMCTNMGPDAPKRPIRTSDFTLLFEPE